MKGLYRIDGIRLLVVAIACVDALQDLARRLRNTATDSQSYDRAGSPSDPRGSAQLS